MVWPTVAIWIAVVLFCLLAVLRHQKRDGKTLENLLAFAVGLAFHAVLWWSGYVFPR